MLDESVLRHPLERPIFIASVILNFALMGLAIAFIFAAVDQDITR